MDDISLSPESVSPMAEKRDAEQAHVTKPAGDLSNSSLPTVTFRSVSVLVRGLGESNAPIQTPIFSQKSECRYTRNVKRYLS